MCVAASGYNCPDMDIVSMDSEGMEGGAANGGKVREDRVGVEVWIQEIGMAFTQRRRKKEWLDGEAGENCL